MDEIREGHFIRPQNKSWSRILLLPNSPLITNWLNWAVWLEMEIIDQLNQSIEVKTELVTKIDAELTRFRKLEREQIF